MSTPIILPLCRQSWLWLKKGGKPTRGGRITPILYRWHSFWFERNLELQRALPVAPGLKDDPIFLLGLWRTGTTYLHRLLGTFPNLAYPATWQCMHPATVRLRRPPSLKTTIRPMDKLEIDTFSPQEDEFALLAMGVPSVYRCFFDPRRLLENSCWLEPNNWDVNQPHDWTDILKEFLANVAFSEPRRLVLKSPSHTFRINALKGSFPASSYIYLIRDPVDTLLSNRKMWIAMFERYSLWKWDATMLDIFLCRVFKAAAKAIRIAAQLCTKEKLAVIDYSDLVDHPMEVLDAINRRLMLGDWGTARNFIRPAIDASASYRQEIYNRSSLTGASSSAAAELGVAQRAIFESHGIVL